MFAKKSTMRICSFCKAPNPQRLTECYSCGGSLTAVNPDLPREGENTYPCLNCQGAIPYRAAACPHCGRSLAAAERSKEQRVRQSNPPEGWQVQPLPDGSVIVRRTGMNRWANPLSAVLAISAVGFVFWNVTRSGAPVNPDLFWTLSVGGMLLLVWLVAALFINEQIRIGKNFLELRRDLWFYHSQRRIENGFLRVKTERRSYQNRSYSRSGSVAMLGTGMVQHFWVRTLYASSTGQSIRLQETSQAATLWDGDMAGRGFSCDEIAQLCLYLSDITGWQVFDQAAQRYGK